MYICVHIQIHTGVIIEDFESLSCFGFYRASALSLSEVFYSLSTFFHQPIQQNPLESRKRFRV